MSIFGRMVDGSDVEVAMQDTLVKWADTYLAESARQADLPAGALPSIASWAITPDARSRFPEATPPAVLVVCPGLAKQPVRQGDGTYTAIFEAGFAVIVEAPENVAKLYTAALRVALLQHPSLGGFANGIEWLDEKYDPVPNAKRRSLNAGRVAFTVEVRDALNAKAGPVEPDPAPHPDWPTVKGGGADLDPQPTD